MCRSEFFPNPHFSSLKFLWNEKKLHLSMKSASLDLFWVEKIKLTQHTINISRYLSDRELDFPDPENPKTVRKALQKIVADEKVFAFYLPVSIKVSSLLPLDAVDPAGLEWEFLRIRDIANPPALPPYLSNLIARESSDLDWTDTNISLVSLWQDWQKSLSIVESTLQDLSEEEALKLRYFTWRGMYALPSAVNLTAMQSYATMHTAMSILSTIPNQDKVD